MCFIQLASSRSGKSSLAWAPLDSFLLAADSAVCTAHVKRFRSSRDSTRSLFQIHTLIFRTKVGERLVYVLIRFTPSSRDSWVRKQRHQFASPSAWRYEFRVSTWILKLCRTLSSTLMVSAPASALISLCGSPGLNLSRMV